MAVRGPSSAPAAQVMSMLDRLYTKLDAAAAELGLFKVETIGDAARPPARPPASPPAPARGPTRGPTRGRRAQFVAAGGVPHWQPDHTLRVAKFAAKAVAIANGTAVDLEDPSKGFVSIRVGFHVGPIVASVVGTSRPKYTLFGGEPPGNGGPFARPCGGGGSPARQARAR